MTSFTEFYFNLGYEDTMQKQAGSITEGLGALPLNPVQLAISLGAGGAGYLNDDKSKVDDSAWASNLFLPGVGAYRMGKRLKGVKGTGGKDEWLPNLKKKK